MSGSAPGPRPVAPTSRPAPVPAYRAERLATLDEFLRRAQALTSAGRLPFHSPAWLRAWYDSLGRQPGTTPLLVAVRSTGTAAGATALDADEHDVMLCPFVLVARPGWREVRYADAGVVDYIAPILHPQWHGSADPARAAAALWQALSPALAVGQVLRLDKLLPQALAEGGGVPNPLALALPTVDSVLFGNHFEVAGDWSGWRHSLDKRVRKEIERCWRVFERSPVARLEHITDPARAAELLAVLEDQQAQRLQAMGADYRLAEPAYADFYRRLLADGLADGSVVLTALLDGDAVVSVLLGVANGSRYIGLRQSLGGDAWKACSPGRLLDEGTARLLHARGWRHFDFGVGDYFHKSTLNMARTPLLASCVALSWRGWPVVLAWRLKRWARHQSWLTRWRRRWRHRANA